MAAAPHARKARASNRTEGTSMIADVRLFRHGTSVGSRVAPHVWVFVLAGSAPRRGPAALKRALDRATRLAPAHRVVAIVSRDSARACAGVLAETPDVATIVQPAYRGSAAELFLPALLVARRDPDAVVLALRADETHDGPVAPCLARAIRAVDLRPDLTVLVGARPRTTRAPDGFVEPGSPLEGCEELSLLAVRRFVYEAPRGLCARDLLAPAGVPVTVAPSWLLGVALTAWTVADALLPEAVPGRSTGAYATIGVATAATLALTLALHEAAHCAVARRAGLEVCRITLSFLGGALELAGPPATPAVEARVALAGPLASAGAALLATAAHLMLVAAGVHPLLPAAAP